LFNLNELRIILTSGRDSNKQVLDEIKLMLSKNQGCVKATIQSNASLREQYPLVEAPASIFHRGYGDVTSQCGSGTLDQYTVTAPSALEFDFDDELMNSRAYRRLLHAKARVTLRAPQKQPDEIGNPIDLSDPFDDPDPRYPAANGEGLIIAELEGLDFRGQHTHHDQLDGRENREQSQADDHDLPRSTGFMKTNRVDVEPGAQCFPVQPVASEEPNDTESDSRTFYSLELEHHETTTALTSGEEADMGSKANTYTCPGCTLPVTDHIVWRQWWPEASPDDPPSAWHAECDAIFQTWGMKSTALVNIPVRQTKQGNWVDLDSLQPVPKDATLAEVLSTTHSKIQLVWSTFSETTDSCTENLNIILGLVKANQQPSFEILKKKIVKLLRVVVLQVGLLLHNIMPCTLVSDQILARLRG
jgi:hypothetical protein